MYNQKRYKPSLSPCARLTHKNWHRQGPYCSGDEPPPSAFHPVGNEEWLVGPHSCKPIISPHLLPIAQSAFKALQKLIPWSASPRHMDRQHLA